MTIGDYSGESPTDAKAALAALCDDPQPCVKVLFVPVESTDVGFRQVISTDPASGSTVAKGGTVTMSVSVGERSSEGRWFETTDTNHTYSCIANRFGFKPWQDLNSFNPMDDIKKYDHFAPGDLIWIPAGHEPTSPVTDNCRALGAEES